MSAALEAFHFLRPLWLLALPPALALWLLLGREADARRPWRGIVAPHLLPHLLVGGGEANRVRPHHVLLAAWIVATLALAGPTWRREPAPFAEDRAALVVVLAVRPSMLERDVQPSRLARAVQKIQDLMAVRPGAKTGLVAYAGSAHRVVPLTDDPAIIQAFAPALAPELMPVQGDAAAAALRLAAAMIARSGQPGSILLIADSVAPDQLQPDQLQPDLPRATILAPVAEGPELASLRTVADQLGGSLVEVTPDDADVRRLTALVETSIVAAASEGGERWQDAGYWLVPLVALLTLLWFRPGWVARAG